MKLSILVLLGLIAGRGHADVTAKNKNATRTAAEEATPSSNPAQTTSRPKSFGGARGPATGPSELLLDTDAALTQLQNALESAPTTATAAAAED